MDEIDTLLYRGVDKIYPNREELEKVLRSGVKLRLYQGFDPTGTQLHIGHAVALRKLRQFQELGHKVIFLIGDFTGMIGDPTGKSESRKRLTREQVLVNAEQYKVQAKKILKFDGENSVEIKFNSTWLDKLSFAAVLELASFFTVGQMIERDMFQSRLKEGREISLVEFLYPLMVAYDAVAMDVDMELGGSDQTFNMLVGRKLHAHKLHKEKYVMTVPLLTDAKGTKIGKTEGNVIGITDPPSDFYGKIMALGDDAILPCFTLLTDLSLEEIVEMKSKMAGGENPMFFKMLLAFELTKQFNGEDSANEAQRNFELIHQKGKASEATLPSIPIGSFTSLASLVTILVEAKLVVSKSEAKRLIDQKAVEINGTIINNQELVEPLKSGDILKVGKKNTIKITGRV